MATDTTPSIYEMSDDDILNMNAPPVVTETTETGDNTAKEDEVVVETGEDTSTADAGGSGEGSGSKTEEDQSKEDKTDKDEKDTKTEETQVEDVSNLSDEEILARDAKDKSTKVDVKPADQKQDTKTEDKSDTEKVEDKDKVEDKSTETTEEPNYKGFYEEVMKPFKANGKTIELRNPEEARKLMQMGANYTRRMQELSQARKLAMTLESNGITEDKLSFLIDLEKKDPEAIKKLLKDSNIDPMDIDVTTEPTYVPGNHQVTDEAVQFKTELDEVSSTPEGRETLTAINDTWDDASKDALWKQPEIMKVMHQHRTDGIYDVVSAEVDRRRTLGEIPANTPFLQAYKVVGDELAAQAIAAQKTGGEVKQETGTETAPTTDEGQSQTGGQIVATRAAVPKPSVKDNERANAASTTRSIPSKSGETTQPNYLAMSDDEFLKQMSGRV